jgi:hypothetical protein
MAVTEVFNIDASDALDKLVKIQEELVALKAAQKEYATAVKEGNDVNGQAAKAYEVATAAIKNVNQEQRILRRQVEGSNAIIKQNTSLTNFNNNTVQQNRDLLKQLTAQYINAEKAQRDKLAPSIKRLSDELKKQEGAIGDTRRNVGNYADALSGLPGGLGKAVTGVKGFNAALSANPIGAVVQLLVTLANALQSNAKVADFFSFALGAVNKVFQTLVDLVVKSDLAQGLINLFENPKQAAMDFVDFIVNNFSKRVEAVGKIFDALKNGSVKDLGNALIQLGTGVEDGIDKLQDFGNVLADAATEGFNAAKAADTLTVSQAKLNAQIDENRIQVQALEKSLKDRTKSEQERIKIANKAADLEIENSKLAVALAKEELAAEELKLKGKTLSAEEEAKLIGLNSKVKQAAAEANIAEAERETRINILLQKELTSNLKEEKAQQNDDLEKAREKELQIEEQYKKLIADLNTQFILNDRERLEKQFQDKIELITGQSEQELELIKAIEEKKAEVLKEFDEKETARIKAELDKRLSDEITAFNKQIQAEKNARDAKILIAQEGQQILSSLLTLFGQESAAAAAFSKTLALFQIGVDSATAISAAYCSGCKSWSVSLQT